MEEYYELLDKAHEQGFRIKEKRCFKSDAEALINRNVIGLSEKLQTQTEKSALWLKSSLISTITLAIFWI